MDSLIESIIEDERPNLVTENKVALRETISKIEERFLSEKQVAAKETYDRNFVLLQLIKVGLELQNTDLLLILVARLKLGQVALTLQSTLQQQKGKTFALSYVGEYFHIDHEPIKQQLLSLNHNDCDTIFDLKSLAKLFIESNDWKKASEFSNDTNYGPSINRLICLKLAQQYEAMENFYEALINYEISESQVENSIRVIIKQFHELSCAKLKEFCLTNELLNDFWNEYSLFLSSSYLSSSEHRFRKQPEIDGHTDDIDPKQFYNYKCGLIRRNSLSLDSNELNTIIDVLPEKMKKLINESNNSKNWLNKRTIEGIIAIASSLDLSTKHRLSRRALHYRQSNRISKACALFLCLDELTAVSQLSSQFLNHSEASQLNLSLCLPEASAVNILRLIRSHFGSTNNQAMLAVAKRGNSSIWKHCHESAFFSALNLGLIDEAMRSYCDIFPMINEDSIRLILDNLENFVATRHNGSLDRIDPTIKVATLMMLKHNLSLEKIPLTPVISIIIYCMAIYTYKLDYSSSSSSHRLVVSIPIRVIRILENMLENVSDFMIGSQFNATNSLVRSTNILVTAIKDKLEIVSDSEIIRVGIKNLVDAIASRCLVESQFKQAATLYSQIEDHACAIKSLMRLGDIDTVVNYSLFVRDITIYRLTINYLKHLDVDSKIIEDFITKSKQQQQQQ